MNHHSIQRGIYTFGYNGRGLCGQGFKCFLAREQSEGRGIKQLLLEKAALSNHMARLRGNQQNRFGGGTSLETAAEWGEGVAELSNRRMENEQPVASKAKTSERAGFCDNRWRRAPKRLTRRWMGVCAQRFPAPTRLPACSRPRAPSRPEGKDECDLPPPPPPPPPRGKRRQLPRTAPPFTFLPSGHAKHMGCHLGRAPKRCPHPVHPTTTPASSPPALTRLPRPHT